MSYAVCVTFTIKPEAWDVFLPLIRANARSSLKNEEGCHRFDVLTDPAYPHEVFLYELYASPAAFDAHLASDHFKSFDAATVGMVAGKAVKRYIQVTS